MELSDEQWAAFKRSEASSASWVLNEDTGEIRDADGTLMATMAYPRDVPPGGVVKFTRPDDGPLIYFCR